MNRYQIFADYLKTVKIPFGFISFNALHANIDVVALRMKGKFRGEIILIQFFGDKKVGWIYFDEVIPHDLVAKIYADVPENYNDLEKYEKDFAEKLEVIDSAKNNYLFLNDREIIDLKNTNYAKIYKPKRKPTSEPG